MKMTPKEVDEHIQALVSGKKKVSGLEDTVVKELKKASEAGNQLQKREAALSAELENVRAKLQSNGGQCAGYINLLVEAEAARRVSAEEPAPAPAPAVPAGLNITEGTAVPTGPELDAAARGDGVPVNEQAR